MTGTKLIPAQRYEEFFARSEDFSYWQERELDDIATDYVKGQVESRPWEDYEHILTLMQIEMFCIRHPRHLAEAMFFGHLKQTYPEEYRSIMSEIYVNWSGWSSESEREKEERIEKFFKKKKEREAIRLMRLASEKKAWMELGGKP